MRIKKLTSIIMFFCLMITLLAGCSGGSDNDSVESNTEVDKDKVHEFNVSFAAPEAATVPLTDVFRRMEQTSEGRLKFNIFYSWSLSSVDSVIKDLQSGVTDIAVVPPHEHLNLFPRTSLITGTPFLGLPGILEAGEIYNEMLEEYPSLKAEYEDLELTYWTTIFMPQNNLFQTGSYGELIVKPSDLRGHKIIGSNTMMQKLIASNSGAPVTAHVTEYYSNLEKGVADSVVQHLSALNAFGCGELIKKATVFGDSGMMINSMALIFSTNKWNSLPEDLQQIFTSEAENLRIENAKVDEFKIKAAMDKLSETAEVYTLTDAELKEWKDAFEPILKEYIDQLEADGADDAWELYEGVIEKVANY
ncbi:hypothetical protein GC105_02895 [Alkalibaculum sp. M08DMB]|uniref:TRAP transporter substrate-binding protein DctP n=1 Tax=Alkalibaculum sporogenes TaxID=2655001 RepID=A0A6A7K692_9FIRM|nr:TRAP transporter substrate-binding protein DctP [Alkalibaculum sporogenes]MPW24737.1 hypothetical protein [Alkalibaculum sporogenes]